MNVDSILSSPSRQGFTLLEVLVAMAVLAIMMVFMLNMVAQATVAWESGSRQIDAAQAARIGLDLIARDLQHAVSASVAVRASGGVVTNYAPFYFNPNPTGIPGEQASALRPPPGSGQLFAVAPLAPEAATNAPFVEIGFFSAFSVRTNGFVSLAPLRYYLMWHSPSRATTGEPISEIYYRGSANSNWLTTTNDTVQADGNRMALVDNCYQMQILFATNDASGRLVFPPNLTNWSSQDSLPAGALITLKVMDRKTAARIASLKRTDGLSPDDVRADSTTTAGRVLREGTVVVSRFVPFLNSTN